MIGHDEQALHHVPQLADVPLPGVSHQSLDGLRGEGLALEVVLFGKGLAEIFDQHRDVFLFLPQRGGSQGDHIQPEKQVVSKLSFLDGPLQILVGGGDDPDIHLADLV
ncbi:MAG: hypothetical protein WCB96_02965 [Candidatus Aminicenantales bacterium]